VYPREGRKKGERRRPKMGSMNGREKGSV
jgi:hypothetical protein